MNRPHSPNAEPPSDDELVERVQAGELSAFDQLYRRHREDVARLTARMLGSRARVDQAALEDLVQEAFVQVFRSLPSFRGQSRLSTWIYRITVNVVLMARRAERCRPRLAPEDYAVDEPRDVEALPDELTDRRSRLKALQRLLERLTEKKRTVFVLHELEGLAPTDIARIVGAPVLTVRTRLFYARRELTAMLAEEPSLRPLLASLTDSLTPPSETLSAAQSRETVGSGVHPRGAYEPRHTGAADQVVSPTSKAQP